ncbi:hypothetical protein NKH85_08670 [Mesorhizobium sp. M0924]|uniref:hypothetical protein n=1 Tax=unclassified Mesorhizobium TaxID=325217 RepID=UPI0033374183
MGIILIIAALLPLLLVVGGWLLGASFIPGGHTPSTADNWTTSGVVLSYLGVLFSSYAAFEVNRLSTRYFAKARFPEIRNSLTRITSAMAKSAGKNGAELRSESFMAQISVFLRSIRRIRGHGMAKVIDKAENDYRILVDWINSSVNKDMRANYETSYWNLFRTLSEISEEIDTYIKEQEAR